MKTMGIAAGALALVSALPALAQTTQDNKPSEVTPPTGNPPTTETPPLLTETPADTGETRGMSAPVRAPKNAFEVGVDAGYAQGFGNLQQGRKVRDAASGGGAVGLNLGYRINPRWSVGATGQFQGYGAGNLVQSGTSVRGASGGVQGTFHTAPYNRLDPWVSFGAGYRAMIESPRGAAPTTITHGLEVARVELGLDVRASESVAISPVLGADVSMFMWKSGGGAETARLSERGVSTFIFAGVKGRFDVAGTREAKPEPKPAEQLGNR